MKSYLQRTLAVLVFSLAVGAAPAQTSAQESAWNHNPANLVEGPLVWGEIDETFRTCGSGVQQSPVNISLSEVAPGGSPALILQYGDTPFVVENNGHVIEVPYGQGSTLRIGGDVYRLLQFHFHAPSEHTVNGQSVDLEAHLVHRNSSGQLAVIGVLMKVADNPNPLVEQVFQFAPEEEGEIHVEGAFLNAVNLLPAFARNNHAPVVLNAFYAYPGSLTTPPCSEGVRWYVLKELVAVSPEAVARLHERVSHFPGYDGYDDNNRPTQPLNERRIISR